MQHVAPLAPLLLAAAFVGSFGAPAAPRAATSAAPAAASVDGRAVADPPSTVDAAAREAEPAAEADAGRGLSAAGRWIVLLRDGSSVNGAETRARRIGVAVDRTFRNVVRGYSARLSDVQVATLRADPTVEAVVPDEVISMTAQSTPRGVRRVFATQNPISRIDGIDQRVDADVAIVDTGIDKDHGDLNVVGGVNCSSTNRSAWDDGNGHGTHVAGIVGAIDNGAGVVGVAPGVRLWAVRILNSGGSGLISWYVCGLDWITAQRDPADPSRPLIEAVNMSVAKSGRDDHNCGLTNHDPMHRAVCRLVGSGVTVVAAAGNNHFSAARLVPASYNEVITVSALADSDGRPGSRGGKACYSWGSYDKDDTFANFSNYGSDVDLIAPGKCILSTVPGGYGFLSGTSMAAPHVTAAAALYKASRPTATPSQVRSALRAFGNHDWKQSTDPDGTHEPLLDVARIVLLGDFAMSAPSPSKVLGPAGGSFRIRVEAIRAEDVPDPISLSVDPDSPLGRLPVGHPALGVQRLDLAADRQRSGRHRHRDVLRQRDGRDRRDLAHGAGRDRGRHDRPDHRPAVAGHRLDRPVQRRSIHAHGPDGRRRRTRRPRSAATRSAGAPTVGRGGRRPPSGRRRGLPGTGSWSATATGSRCGPGTPRATGADGARPARSRPTSSRTAARASRGRAPGTCRTPASWSGGTTRYTKARGASIGRSFTGKGIALVAPMGPNRGAARVYVDGTLARTIHLGARNLHPRRILFTTSWKTTATHSIRVVGNGTRHHRRVDVDAFVILR